MTLTVFDPSTGTYFLKDDLTAGQADYEFTLAPGIGMTAIAGDSTALLNEINLVLAGGQVSAGTVGTLKVALDTIPANSDAGRLNRVQAALVLVLASPEYIVQK